MLKYDEKRNIIYHLNLNNVNNKNACFDLDNTIITTKGNNIFPKNKDDWKFLNNNVEKSIKKLIEKKYNVIIFSNQCNLDNKQIKYKNFIEKIKNINMIFNNKLNIIISLRKNNYRKPNIGMWNFYLKQINKKININKCFYVGDAAGRENDFSDDDINFAKNIGIIFYTPEIFFFK